MYIALRCKCCGREHPIRELTHEDIIALMTFARHDKIHEIAANKLSSREWFYILTAELLLRSRRS